MSGPIVFRVMMCSILPLLIPEPNLQRPKVQPARIPNQESAVKIMKR